MTESVKPITPKECVTAIQGHIDTIVESLFPGVWAYATKDVHPEEIHQKHPATIRAAIKQMVADELIEQLVGTTEICACLRIQYAKTWECSQEAMRHRHGGGLSAILASL